MTARLCAITKDVSLVCWIFVTDSLAGQTVTVYSLARNGQHFDTLSSNDYSVVWMPDPSTHVGTVSIRNLLAEGHPNLFYSYKP